MPVWLQLTAAIGAAVAAGVMGIALIPYLTKLRLCDREKTEEQDDAPAKELLRPTMGGLLLGSGILFGLVLGVTLYREFGGADRTGDAFRAQSDLLRTALLHGVLLGTAGFLTDHSRVRGRLLFGTDPRLRLAAVCCVTLGLFAWQAGLVLRIVPAALAVTACFALMQLTERDKTEGVSLPLGIVQLLALTMLLLKEKETLPAVYTLAGAGACMGCMVWCLHPAKCRLGCTGSYLLGSMVPVLCAAQGRYKTLALLTAVYAVNALPLLKHRQQTLLGRMESAGTAAAARMAALTGFAAFCGALAVLFT